MNIILNPLQSNTKKGDIVLKANADLTGKENYLVKIVNNSGVGNFALPAATDDQAVYVLASGAAAGLDVAAEAPSTNENFRVVLKGTCDAGDILSLADPSTAADAGKLCKQPTTAGTWRAFAIAEEGGVDGQYILARKISERTTIVS
jgi:hypothetical protein